MPTVLLALSMSFLLLTGSVYATCPPVVKDGKLHAILPLVNQKVTYSDVVDCGSVSQADLFRRARLWIAQSGQSSGESFAINDKEAGDLAGRFTQVVMLPRSESAAGGIYTFRYSYIIECANRKYRATITQISLDEGNGHYTPVETYCQKNEKDLQGIYAELNNQLNSVLVSLQENVKNYKVF